MAKRLIISASPHVMGKSARVAKELSKLLSAKYPADEIDTLRLSDLDIRYCQGCNTCGETNECFIEDGMKTVLDALSACDALYIVSPIYFAGPPANYKAMLDRLQPFYWTWEKGQPKRPVTLIALGGGGDPYGYDPLVTCTRSALSLVGFEMAKVLPYIGEDLSSSEIASKLAEDL